LLARELLGTDLAWMGLVDEESGTLDMRVAVGATTEPFMAMRLALGDGVGGVVVANRAPLVVEDYARERPPTPNAISHAILGEGIGSMLCCPMLTGDKVVGALYVGSRRPLEFGPIEVALTSALAAQGAVAIENGRLYAALAEQNRVLEGSFAVHRTLTDAALTGAGRAHICVELARLLGAEVVLEQDISPPFRACFGVHGEVDDAVAGVGVPVEDLGRLHVSLDRLSPLQEKALEHAATVLALELVKERAQQQVEWQLQGDLLSELLDATAPLAPSLAARARRHGVDLARAHRIVVIRADDPDLLTLVRRTTGRAMLHRDASLVCQRGEDVVLAARDGDVAEVIRAVTAAAERRGLAVAIGVSAATAGTVAAVAAAAAAVAAPHAAAPRAALAAAVAAPHAAAPGAATAAAAPRAAAPLSAAFRQAAACAHLAGSRGGGVVGTDQLGPLRFLLDAPDLSQVRAVVREQLGPVLAHSGGRTDLLATLRAFVAADGNVAETARACFIHKNTLRYRLTRLTEVLGRDPAEPDTKFHLRMAFDLVELFAGMGIDLLPPRRPGLRM
jgi:DNA-binding PucR family transcriptional regulator/putative methionine-R-sulfoxide reductase with GAF domain